jgi:uncharacterized membrane protein
MKPKQKIYKQINLVFSMKKRDLILLIGAVSFIILIIFLSLLLGDKFQVRSCGCPNMVSQNFIIIFIILAVIFVGSLLYYLLSLKIDSQKGIIEKNIEVLHSILDKNERIVINLIIRNNGEIPQSEISKKMGKLKSHRTVKKLIDKKIIDTTKKGRENTIILKKELKQQLVK